MGIGIGQQVCLCMWQCGGGALKMMWPAKMREAGDAKICDVQDQGTISELRKRPPSSNLVSTTFINRKKQHALRYEIMFSCHCDCELS